MGATDLAQPLPGDYFLNGFRDCGDLAVGVETHRYHPQRGCLVVVRERGEDIKYSSAGYGCCSYAITMVDLHDAVWVVTSHSYGTCSDNNLVAGRHSRRLGR